MIGFRLQKYNKVMKLSVTVSTNAQYLKTFQVLGTKVYFLELLVSS